MTLSVSALISDRKIGRFDVFQSMLETLDKNHENLQEGDIIVISTKYISNSQGRIVNLNKIQISFEGEELSKKFQIKPEISEIIIRESDKIFGGIAGFVITSADHIMAPNAGIDKYEEKYF
jgi:coenzyme F420-0:L-glutamate ligase/coenzyme F420-1:gamma-L-glutamate ligase